MNPAEVLKDHINPASPRLEIVPNMPEDEYRNFPAFAASDLKLSDPAVKSFQGPRGSLIRMVDRIRARKEMVAKGFVPFGYEKLFGDTPATRFGTLYHAWLLKRNEFEKCYTVLNDDVKESILAARRERKLKEIEKPAYKGNLKGAQLWKEKSGRLPKEDHEKQEALDLHVEHLTSKIKEDGFNTKLSEYEAWAEAEGKAGRIILQEKELTLVQLMSESAKRLSINATPASYLESCNDAERAEVSLFFPVRIGETVLQLKARIDACPPDDTIPDLKTCLSCHNLDVASSVHQSGYAFSMGYYLWLSQQIAKSGILDQATLDFWGFPKHRAVLINQEKDPPYLMSSPELPGNWLNHGAARAIRLLGHIASASESGDWDNPPLRDGELPIDPFASHPDTPKGALAIPDRMSWLEYEFESDPQVLTHPLDSV